MADMSALFGAPSARTFLGLPAAKAEDVPADAIAVVGIPGATPYRSAGPYCASGPAAIRAASARHAGVVTHYDFDLAAPLPSTRVFDAGDLPFDPDDFERNRAGIRSVVGAWLDRGIVPIVLGGDDSVQLPVIEAHASRRDVTIVQIDAHIDWRDEVQGERYGLSSTMRRASEIGGVKAIIQVGARSVGSARPSDVADALAAGVTLFEMRRLRREGLGAVIQAVPTGRPVVICLDVDGLDPSIVPAVIGRAPGGLDYGDMVELFAGLAARAPIVGVQIVELVPENDIGGLGAAVAARLAVLGIGYAAAAKPGNRGSVS